MNTAILDTNVILRYILKDNVELFERAKPIMEASVARIELVESGIFEARNYPHYASLVWATPISRRVHSPTRAEGRTSAAYRLMG